MGPRPPLLPRHSTIVLPPAQVKAFSGTGHKLGGSGEAGGSGGASTSGVAPAIADAYGAVTWEGADPMLPHTSIQLRLADGSRLRAEFNLSHTVGDIRRWGWGEAWEGGRPVSLC